MDDLAQLCDRILVLNKGCVHALGDPAHVFMDSVAMKQIGLDVPSAQRLANLLKEQGLFLPVPSSGLFTPETLVTALVKAYKEGF